MSDYNNSEIEDLISIDMLDWSSLFAISIVDLESFEVVYINQAMKSIMANRNAKNCWEAKYGLKSPCMWCKAQVLINKARLCSDISPSEQYATYENFNEGANKWYQIQERLTELKNGHQYLISFALDISIQKEAQSQFINSHVQLRQKTLALEEAKKQLKIQATQDPLTGLYNRRYFQDVSQKLINLARRESNDLSVIMLDIDKFKNINDSYGHGVGDIVIKSLATLLQKYSRKSDVIARIGGEEFAILLPNTNKDGALGVASKITEMVSKQKLKVNKSDSLQFTISSGVDCIDVENDLNLDAALNRADSAMYLAKRSGRNKAVLYDVKKQATRIRIG